jgi:hypothetical protein
VKANTVKFIIGGDAWEFVRGVDGLRAIGSGSFDIGDDADSGHEDVVIVDPSSRQIVAGSCFTNEALGTAIMHCIEISTHHCGAALPAQRKAMSAKAREQVSRK